jgi:hypothetical protein
MLRNSENGTSVSLFQVGYSRESLVISKNGLTDAIRPFSANSTACWISAKPFASAPCDFSQYFLVASARSVGSQASGSSS